MNVAAAHALPADMDGRVPILYTAGALLWICAVGVGLVQLWNYENGPGARATAPSHWPAGTALTAPHGRPTLVLFLHPQCSCSHATVAELARLQARIGAGAAIQVVMLAPFGMPAGWINTSLAGKAAAIPGVIVRRDDNGAEAARFGAATSGQTLVYDTTGRLRFSGGITGSRGHEGDNAGRHAIEQLIRTGDSAPRSTLVFGCSLFSAEQP